MFWKRCSIVMLVLLPAMAVAQTVNPILTNHTPNEGRIIINANFATLRDSIARLLLLSATKDSVRAVAAHKIDGTGQVDYLVKWSGTKTVGASGLSEIGDGYLDFHGDPASNGFPAVLRLIEDGRADTLAIGLNDVGEGFVKDKNGIVFLTKCYRVKVPASVDTLDVSVPGMTTGGIAYAVAADNEGQFPVRAVICRTDKITIIDDDETIDRLVSLIVVKL